jgi:aspartyl protease family protein
MLAWAIRILALWGALGIGAYLLLTGSLLPGTPEEAADHATLVPTAPAAPSPPRRPIGNSMTVPADASGHYIVTAQVNGTPVRFLVDTGASIIALTPDDAHAAGFDRGRLDFDGRMQTANGAARFARVTLREIRLGAISLNDIDAAVMPARGGISLLGMNFLKQLDAYEIRDGQLTLWW